MSGENEGRNLAFGSDVYRSIVLKSGGLLYTTYVNRNLAWACSRILCGLSPNQISIGAFCILFVALPLAYTSTSLATSLVAYALLVVNYVLDSSDGQVSRLRNMGSPLGEWVDHTLDGVRILLTHSTLLLIVLSADVSRGVQIAAFLNIVFASSMFFGTELAAKLLTTKVHEDLRGTWSFRRVVRNLLLLPADYGIFIMMFVIIHRPALLAKVYGAYGIFWVTVFTVYFIWTFRANSRTSR